ncbi:MAG TPA: hypothetical protein VHY32_05255 [Caulobacteraceae bacterium]|jgi:hypothetical protein|nr:hypothetical protein [Caulobacteraceae bacterium]
MAGLTETQATILRTLFGTAPDTAVQNLERALAEEAFGGGPMATVYGLVAREAQERRAKQVIFQPLLALGKAGAFPPGVLKTLWAALRAVRSDQADTAVSYSSRKKISDENLAKAMEVYDALCAEAARGLRGGAPAFAAAIAVLNADRPDGVEQFARYLDLTPLARAALARLPDWMGRMTEDRAAAVKVAYKDAVAQADDAGPRFLEILAANLPDPWLIMRILSAVMDHPAERYVAVSELAPFAERVLDDVDNRLGQFRAFDPDGGRAAGLAAGEAIQTAAMEIVEFETAIELNRESPWGKRVMQQRQTLAQLAEARLAQIDKALEAAMPLQMVKFGKGVRGHPRLNDDPNPVALRRAEALMAFFDYSRHFASQSGYGAARAKTAEKIEARLDQYVEDLLEMLRTQEAEMLRRVHGYLDISATMMAAARGEKAGQIVRRRAAAA